MHRHIALFCLFLLGCPDDGGAPPPGDAGARTECALDEARCRDEHTEMRCVDGAFVAAPCSGVETCRDDRCRPTDCNPGSFRCGETMRQKCREDGLGWDDFRCPRDAVCVGDGSCQDLVCEPGALRCHEDQAAVRQQCAGDGMSWQDIPCQGRQLCHGGECKEPICRPGGSGCIDETHVGTCDEDGLSYIDPVACPDGEGCHGGVCVSLCERARERSSYDGCRFFAVDLPQYGEPAERFDRHPFAVVLANPSDIEGRVTITRAGDQVVDIVASQFVRDFRTFGGGPGGTVYSESVDGNDRRTRLSGPARDVVIPPGGLVSLILPDNTAATFDLPNGGPEWRSELADRSFRVDTTVPVTAYQFQPVCCAWSFTADATILIPSGSLGQHYFAVSHSHLDYTWNIPLQGEVHESIPSFLSIAASDQPATVDLILGNRQYNAVDDADVTVAADGTMTANLEPYEVLTLISEPAQPVEASDFTGVEITADSEVAVFGGHVCTYIPHGVMSCDHLETINLPVETWRNEYLGVHTVWRGNAQSEVNYYRVQASEDDTTLTFDPPLRDIATFGPVESSLPDCRHMGRTPVLHRGEWCEFGTRTDFHLTGDHPIALTQFISGAATTGGSDLSPPPGASADPSMSIVPPAEQYRTEYQFLMPDTYEKQYVVFVHPGGSLLEVDGVSVSAAEMGNAARTPYLVEQERQIGASRWYRTVVRLGPGGHFVSDLLQEPFGINVHAYNEFVSYAYPGGMNLTKQQQ